MVLRDIPVFHSIKVRIGRGTHSLLRRADGPSRPEIIGECLSHVAVFDSENLRFGRVVPAGLDVAEDCLLQYARFEGRVVGLLGLFRGVVPQQPQEVLRSHLACDVRQMHQVQFGLRLNF
jgi:hypothetical protein